MAEARAKDGGAKTGGKRGGGLPRRRTDEGMALLRPQRARFIAPMPFLSSLPPVPAEPKLVKVGAGPRELLEFKPSLLDEAQAYKLLVQTDLGAPVDLLHPEMYRIPEAPLPLDPADEALLRDGDGEEHGRGSAKARSVAALPWLMNTQYISNDLYTKSTAPGLSEKKAKQLRMDAQGGPEGVPDLSDRDKQIVAIQASFDAAAKAPKHATKRSVTPVEVLPLLPDFELWGHQFVHVHFDADPLDKVPARVLAAERAKMAADALLKQYTVQGEDEEEEQRILAYMVPAPAKAEAGEKRARDGDNGTAGGSGADGEAEAKRAKRQALLAAGLLDDSDEDDDEEGKGGEAGGGGAAGGAAGEQGSGAGGEEGEGSGSGAVEYAWLTEYSSKPVHRKSDESLKEQYLVRSVGGSIRYSDLNTTLELKASFSKAVREIRPSSVHVTRTVVDEQRREERLALRDTLLAAGAASAGVSPDDVARAAIPEAR